MNAKPNYIVRFIAWVFPNGSDSVYLAIETSAGSLIGIPFLLERSLRETSYPSPNGTRKRKTFSLLSIRVHPSRASQVLEIIETKAFQ